MHVKADFWQTMWSIVKLHDAQLGDRELAQTLHRWLAIQAGKMSSAHLIRNLLPAYLEEGLPISGTYLDTLISNCGRSSNLPYAWVKAATCTNKPSRPRMTSMCRFAALNDTHQSSCNCPVYIAADRVCRTLKNLEAMQDSQNEDCQSVGASEGHGRAWHCSKDKYCELNHQLLR